MHKSVLIATCVAGLAAAPAAADEWENMVVLYGWFSGLEGEIGVANVGEVPVSATFDDLAGFIDFAMAGHFEARSTKSVFLTDVFYVGLSDTRDATVANQPITVDMDLNQWIIEIGGGYRLSPEFDALLAVRYYVLDMGATSTSIAGSSTGDASQAWADIYLGARYTKPFGEHFFASVRGDVGVGGSEFAWFANTALGYRFNKKFSTAVAWRVLSLDREGDADNPFIYDITQSGLGIGLGYSF